MGKEREKASAAAEAGLNNQINTRGLAIKQLLGVRKLSRDSGDARRSRNAAAGVDLERLSGVEDPEISCYLQNKKEMHYKKMIWELMNKNIEVELKRKQQEKQLAKAKNATLKKNSKVENDLEIKRQSLSSKINFDALKEQMEEEQEDDSKEANCNDVPFDHGNEERVSHLDHKFNSNESYSGNEDFDNEEEQDYDEDLDVSNGDYNFDNEEDEYIYNEDYDD